MEAVEATEVGGDLPTLVVVVVLPHLFEAATVVVVEGSMTVADLEDALEEGMYSACPLSAPVTALL